APEPAVEPGLAQPQAETTVQLLAPVTEAELLDLDHQRLPPQPHDRLRVCRPRQPAAIARPATGFSIRAGRGRGLAYNVRPYVPAANPSEIHAQGPGRTGHRRPPRTGHPAVRPRHARLRDRAAQGARA